MTGVYYTENGEIFIENDCVYWDDEKQLHYSNVSNNVVVSECEFNVDTSSGSCTIS
ncbi:MAG: hypothetical protein LUG95_03685 [Clostridiales bacterium]|nr:hypothetical protein [Clostridiales bacterium]